MRNLLVKSMVLAVVLSAGVCFAEPIGTEVFPRRGDIVEQGRFGYVLIAAASANDTPLTAADKKWSNIDGNTRWPPIPSQFRVPIRVFVYFHGRDGNDPNVGACDVNLYVANRTGGGQKVAKTHWTAGDVEMSHNPYSGAVLAEPNDNKWAEVPTVTDETYIKTGGTGGAAAGSGGGDIGEYAFDPLNSDRIRAEVYNFDNTNIDYVYVIMTGG